MVLRKNVHKRSETMKQWKEPALEELNISATTEQGHNYDKNGKECIWVPGEPCNAKGNGKGICNNCPLNPGTSIDTGSNTDTLS